VSQSSLYAASASFPFSKSDAEWQLELNPQEFQVLRRAGTERPFTGPLNAENRPGTYYCRACHAPLFSSSTKFDAGCGWPSFYVPLAGDSVILRPDYSLPGRPRTEVLCANCGSHLGHVFDDAPQTPTGDRFCMNSIALTFEPTS